MIFNMSQLIIMFITEVYDYESNVIFERLRMPCIYCYTKFYVFIMFSFKLNKVVVILLYIWWIL